MHAHLNLTGDQTPKYRIGKVSQLTGLSADVVRIWERRYDAIKPKRSAGGTRLYSDADIARLRSLRQAVDQGYAISQVAALPEIELKELAPSSQAVKGAAFPDPYEQVCKNFLAAIERMDVVAADLEISRAAALYPPRLLVKNIAAPLFIEIGQRWAHQAFGIAEEHLASNLLRGLLSALFRLYPPADTGATIVLATPQGERHEFGILLAALYAATHGWRAIYLGADLPAREIVRAVKLSGAQVLALSLVTSPVAETEQELWAIAEQLSRSTRVWLGGGAAANQQDLITRAGWSWLGDLEELDEWLKS